MDTQHHTTSSSNIIEILYIALSAMFIGFALATEFVDGARIWLLLIGPVWLPVSLVAIVLRIRRGRRASAVAQYIKDAVYLAALFASCYYTALLAGLFFGSFS